MKLVGHGLSWCMRRHIYFLLHKHQNINFNRCQSTKTWTSANIREQFLDYFKERDHLYVHSSSVLPHKNEGSYFINAGMNQFKPIFLGTALPGSELASYRRVVNSQKCIRVGGKHNDLADVGKDTYHHTFFEMLGNWSFGDYFKKDACEMAWRLMTDVYKLPKDHLYVTYFDGDKNLGLDADLECKDIWLNLGVSPDHIVACGARDNFWDMGETGPCGPCTEIHYSHCHEENASKLVNAGQEDVIELWNLVFMLYDRQYDGSLQPLPAHHVDTGMGLERLTAVLQGKQSNYDTDLFTPIFSHIAQLANCAPYQGKFGPDAHIDTAYRIVADHLRMCTVAIADGIRPGRFNIDSKLRLVADQCVHQATQILPLPPGSLQHLVPVVIDTLGDAFPELKTDVRVIQDVMSETEDRYLNLLYKVKPLLAKLIETSSSGTIINGKSLLDLEEGLYGIHVPLEMAMHLACQLGINLDINGYQSLKEHKMSIKKQETVRSSKSTDKFPIRQSDIEFLKSSGIDATSDRDKYFYDWDSQSGYVYLKNNGGVTLLALRRCGEFVDHITPSDLGVDISLVLDHTAFYAEAGGQASDTGIISNEDGTMVFEVENVQKIHNYVFHSGRFTVLSDPVKCEDKSLTLTVNQVVRSGCAMNHTATHLLNFALNQVLGSVHQQGSSVSKDKLVFDFTCAKTRVTKEDIEKVDVIIQSMIEENLAVYTEKVPLHKAKAVGTITALPDEAYPGEVRVVSVGVPVTDVMSGGEDRTASVELCGGTHVDNTGRLGAFAITHFRGLQQGTKRVTAVTGETATQALENVDIVNQELNVLERKVRQKSEKESWVGALQTIDMMISGKDSALLLPKLSRDNFLQRLDDIKNQGLSFQKNRSQIQSYIQMLSVVAEVQPDKPTMLFTYSAETKQRRAKKFRDQPKGKKVVYALAYIPEMDKGLGRQKMKLVTAEAWIQHLRNHGDKEKLNSNSVITEGKLPKSVLCHSTALFVSKDHPLQHYKDLAQSYMEHILMSGVG